LQHHVYLFDGHTLDPQRRSLMRGSTEVSLGSRALDLLIALVEHADGVLSRDYLVSRVWPTTVVEDSSLRVHIAALRRALEPGSDASRRIVNVPGRGYRFNGPVSTRARAPGVPSHAHLPLDSALPAALAELLGRESALAAVEAMTARHRIVTIAGPGGVGKSSLALHVLSRLARVFPGQMRRVDLSRASEGERVERVVADTLGHLVPELRPALQGSRTLLLLDNCEHLVEETASFVELLALRAPQAHVLCTSREPLHVAVERVFRLEPLALPPPSVTALAEARRYAAVELFVQRAQASSDTVRFEDADVPLLRSVCERMDGLPLALELAAAAVHTLGLGGLDARPEALLDILTRGRRNAAARHRTLRAVADWSHALLSADERRVFCALSLFDAPFSLSAAVASLDETSLGSPVGEIVLGLVDKSMLVSCPELASHHDGTGFRMSGLLRCYGLQRLAEWPDAAEVRARHERARSVARKASGQVFAVTPTV
jgi:predicted ATPase/DNA-binding winged helix-turn-helix (wHTH) protein